MSYTFNVKDHSTFHGDEDFDPRSDLSQGRGDDTVYPRAIPMDPTSPPQVPQGPMTHARARAFETEVTSLLALLPYESCETWLLPQTGVLCVLRCEGDHIGEELEDGQVPKVMDELKQQEDQKAAPGPGHPAPGPDIWPLGIHLQKASCSRSYRARTSGLGPGNPAPLSREHPRRAHSSPDRSEEHTSELQSPQ